MSATTLTEPRKAAAPARGTCRLELTLNGVPYRVRPLPVGDQGFAVVKAFRLIKADGTAYDTAQTLYGFSCSCADHVWRRDGMTQAPCNHASALVACGLLDGPTPRA